MLHILLLLLKILGIVLLTLLIMLLLLIITTLFVPLRCCFKICRDEGSDELFLAKGKITWFLHFINVSISYPGDVIIRFRIFLFTLFNFPKTEKQRIKAEKRALKKEKKKADSMKEPEQSNDTEREKTAETKDAFESAKATEESEQTVAVVSPDSYEKIEELNLWKKVKIFLSKCHELYKNILSAIQNMQYTFQNICDKISSMTDTIDYYRSVYESDTFQNVFSSCKGELRYVLKKLKPSKFTADIIVGTGDPASTADILGYYGMLYPFLYNTVNVSGDFEQKRLEGTIILKGKVRLFTFVRVAFKVFFNKDIRKLIKLLKKENV